MIKKELRTFIKSRIQVIVFVATILIMLLDVCLVNIFLDNIMLPAIDILKCANSIVMIFFTPFKNKLSKIEYS